MVTDNIDCQQGKHCSRGQVLRQTTLLSNLEPTSMFRSAVQQVLEALLKCDLSHCKEKQTENNARKLL